MDGVNDLIDISNITQIVARDLYAIIDQLIAADLLRETAADSLS